MTLWGIVSLLTPYTSIPHYQFIAGNVRHLQPISSSHGCGIHPSPHCVHCNFFAKLEIVCVCTVTMTRLVIQLCGFRSKTCHILISVNYCINVLASNLAGNIRAAAINFRQARPEDSSFLNHYIRLFSDMLN